MVSKVKRSTFSIVPRAKIWLEAEGRYVFGHGLSEILKAIQQTGSIKDAAEVVGKSYRHVWSRVKDAERALGVSLVETRVGGGETQRSRLTSHARLLVREYDRMRRQVFGIVGRTFTSTLRTIARASAAARKPRPGRGPLR